MKIAIVAPSPVPFVVGGAEKLWWGLQQGLHEYTDHQVELIKLPSPERTFWELMESYRQFSRLDLSHFDRVISTKYPAWMVDHPHHTCYMQHKLRGLYDTYHFSGKSLEIGSVPPRFHRLVRTLRQAPAERKELEPFFAMLFELRAGSEENGDAILFPGPLSRSIVHFLDRIALAPERIERYFAISSNVKQRKDYFPAATEVGVIHHPSDLPRYENTGYGYLFTASRLVSPKRVGMLVEAYRRLDTDVEFRIAGSGPEMPRLSELAQGDPRIRFLGRIHDEEMIRQYAGALFVPFIPYDEDYGLITVEAMASGKAVLTTTDAGGSNELVIDGENGYSVEPNPQALADGMRRLLDDPQQTRRMGLRAKERVADITWKRTVLGLLDEPVRATHCGGGRRQRILVLVDFPVYPPIGGGQKRIYHLYRNLARRADISLLTLTAGRDDFGERRLAPNLREIRIPKSADHLAAEKALQDKLRESVADIAAILYAERTPQYLEALRREAASADLLIASHPYLYPLIRQLPDVRLWYEAHNVEYDMKRAVLGDTELARPYLQKVREAEAGCCRQAQRVMVCSGADGERLAQLYGIDPNKASVVPNGVAAGEVAYVTGDERLRAKQKIGLEGRFCALFIGSWHKPNIEAAGHLLALAALCPRIDFLVLGSIGSHPSLASAPENFHRLGVVSEQELSVVLSAVDVALNPMTSGSGTNLKMLEYAAAGVPIITTPFGARGLQLEHERQVLYADIDAFAPALLRVSNDDPSLGAARVADARRIVEERYDWPAIAERVVLRAPDPHPLDNAPTGAAQ